MNPLTITQDSEQRVGGMPQDELFIWVTRYTNRERTWLSSGFSSGISSGFLAHSQRKLLGEGGKRFSGVPYLALLACLYLAVVVASVLSCLGLSASASSSPAERLGSLVCSSGLHSHTKSGKYDAQRFGLRRPSSILTHTTHTTSKHFVQLAYCTT